MYVGLFLVDSCGLIPIPHTHSPADLPYKMWRYQPSHTHPTTMSTIRYATEADCQALGHINIHAFMSRGFGLLRNLFPQASWDSITPFKAAVSLKRLADPKMHVLVATDPETDSVVGYCRWTIPRGIGYDKELVRLSEEGTAAMEDPKQFAPQPMNEEVYKAFKRILEEKRKRHATEDDFGKSLAHIVAAC